MLISWSLRHNSNYTQYDSQHSTFNSIESDIELNAPVFGGEYIVLAVLSSVKGLQAILTG